LSKIQTNLLSDIQIRKWIRAGDPKLVFAFQGASAFDRFVNSGWESSAQATAAASDGKKGAAYAGAMPVGNGVWLYQLTDKGVAAELTVKGTKFYKDDDLN
jgi:hypothetical protein